MLSIIHWSFSFIYKRKSTYLLGQRPHLFPFLYFLQHFFLRFFPSTIGKAKGKRICWSGDASMRVLCFMVPIYFIFN